MGSNAGLGRGGHAMVTRQAATVEVNLSQAVEFRVTLDHNQRMRNNSGSDSDINSAIAASAPGTVAWGAAALRLRYRARLYAGAMHRPTRLVRPPQVAR